MRVSLRFPCAAEGEPVGRTRSSTRPPSATAPCRVRRTRHPLQHAMRPVMIVIQPPAIHNIPRLGQIQKELAIEAFISKLAVEALHVPVLPGTARLYEQRPNPGLLKPLPHSLAGELRTVVAAEILRTVTQSEQLLQDP